MVDPIVLLCLVIGYVVLVAVILTLLRHIRRATIYNADNDRRAVPVRDELTGAYKLQAFTELIGRLLTAEAELGHLVVLCFSDLDGFKPINDNFGHDVGDQMLKQLTARIEEFAPLVCRLGGDEFAWVMVGDDLISLHQLVIATGSRMVEPYEVINGDGGQTIVRAGVSIGADILNSRETTLQGLQHADRAMYSVKHTSYDTDLDLRYSFFDPAIHVPRPEWTPSVALARLQAAVDEDELRVRFQPIVRLVGDGTSVVVALEALTAWPQQPEGMSPEDVWALVESHSGLIRAVVRKTITLACKAAAAWPLNAAGERVPVLYNLPVGMLDEALPRLIANTLAETGLSPNNLVIELLERDKLQDVDRAVEIMRRIAKTGVRFVIDDYGTGYASLMLLSELNDVIEGIKLSGDLVRDCLSNEAHAIMLENTMQLACRLSKFVVIESVETAEIADVVTRLAIEQEFERVYMQGFYFAGRCQPGPELDRLIADYVPIAA